VWLLIHDSYRRCAHAQRRSGYMPGKVPYDMSPVTDLGRVESFSVADRGITIPSFTSPY
jgi:hypothetical protein